MRGLTGTDVLVGVPSEDSSRSDGPITNAALAYIHDRGAPEAHVPARPFLGPGVEAVRDKIAARFGDAGSAVLEGRDPMSYLHRAGTLARDSVKAKISSNIPPSLAASTVMARIRRAKDPRRRKRLKKLVAENEAAGAAPGAGLFTALVNTGQLRNAINYVLRKRS